MTVWKFWNYEPTFGVKNMEDYLNRKIPKGLYAKMKEVADNIEPLKYWKKLHTFRDKFQLRLVSTKIKMTRKDFMFLLSCVYSGRETLHLKKIVYIMQNKIRSNPKSNFYYLEYKYLDSIACYVFYSQFPESEEFKQKAINKLYNIQKYILGKVDDANI